MQKIHSCLWFDHQAEEAAKFYASLFKNSSVGKVARYGKSGSNVSGQKEGSVMTVEFEINGHKVLGLNGGPMFKFTPALSLFVWSDSEREVNELWEKLSAGGKERMPIGEYHWSKRYGWTSDRFGVEWQIMLSDQKLKIAPSFMFVDKLYGKGHEAVKLYTSVFKNSKVLFMGEDENSKTILHCTFSLDGQEFALMEGKGEHGFLFNEAFSLVVNCETQKEVDHFWEKLSAGGTIQQCGWLKDKFGVSWQIVPTIVGELMSNPKNAENVMKAILTMKKIDIETLKRAAENSR